MKKLTKYIILPCKMREYGERERSLEHIPKSRWSQVVSIIVLKSQRKVTFYLDKVTKVNSSLDNSRQTLLSPNSSLEFTDLLFWHFKIYIKRKPNTSISLVNNYYKKGSQKFFGFLVNIKVIFILYCVY